MFSNPYPGKFIVVEGVDGSGKSTQVNFIADWIKNQRPDLGRELLITHEPYLSTQGKRLRHILEGRQTAPESQLEMQKLYIEDRKEHIENTILPRLKEGSTVISDRYFLSTFAYGIAGGLTFEEIYRLHEEITGSNLIVPDLTFTIDISPEVAFMRLVYKKGEQKLEYFEKQKDFMRRAAFQYRELSNRFPNITLIRGDRPIAEVLEEIAGKLGNFF